MTFIPYTTRLHILVFRLSHSNILKDESAVTSSRCYDCDTTTVAGVTSYTCTDKDALIQLLSSHLDSEFPYVTPDTDETGTVIPDAVPLHTGLLGGITEFVAYVIAIDDNHCTAPLTHCYKASNPVIVATYPLVDIAFFIIGATEADDYLCMQEIKATRNNVQYFGDVLTDYEGMYSKSRLSHKAEALKFQLKQLGHYALIPRINACIGTSPSDSPRVKLIPTGVSGPTPPTSACTAKLASVAATLTTRGWIAVQGIYIRIDDIDLTLKRFARGEGRHHA